MTPEEARKLLGGYATNTLTAEERQALFEAAMADQSLFDALAEEDALRLTLADPAYRRELATMLEPKRSSWWRRPVTLAWAGSMAAVAVVGIVVYHAYQPVPIETVGSGLYNLAEPSEQAAPEQPLRETPQPRPAASRQRSAAPAAPVAPPAEERATVAAEGRKAEAAPPPALPSGDIATAAPKPLAVQKTEAAAPPALPSHEIGGAVAPAETSSSAPPPPSESAVAGGVVGGYPAQAELARSKVQRPDESRPMAYRDVEAAAPGEPASAKRAALSPATLAWQALRRNPDGSYADIKPADRLTIDDAVQLAVVSAADGHIYLVDRTGPERPALLFSGLAQRGVRTLIPAEGALPPPKSPGRRRLVLLFSPEPLALDVLGVSGPFDPGAASFSVEIPLNYRPNR